MTSASTIKKQEKKEHIKPKVSSERKQYRLRQKSMKQKTEKQKEKNQ